MNAGSAVAAFGIFVLLLLWIGLAWTLGRERERVLAQTEAETGNLARAVNEHILRTMAGVDQALLYVKAEYERDPARFNLAEMVTRSAVLRDISVQLAVIGPDGVLRDSTVAGFAPVNLSDREHFRVQRDNANAGLFISKPVLGRASGKWSVQMTRRLNGPKGQFAGVLVMSLNPQYLSDFYGSIDVGTKGVIVLVGQDGIVRAASDGLVGREVAAPLIQSMFSASTGSSRVTGPFDAERRITSFSVVPGLPLAVMVGRSQVEVLARHSETVRMYILVGIGVTLVLGTALLLLYSLVCRQEAIARDLALKKAELTSSRERLRRYVVDLERIAEVAAHDLQEPLRRVVSYAQLLSAHLQAAPDNESQDYIAHVIAGAHRMRHLVQDLEAFVAVDHMPAAERLISANGAARTATASLADELARSDATLQVDALPEVAADERSLTEIFVQLVSNAVRYRSPERKPLIRVSARRDSDFAVFSVSDNGLGIDERQLPRVFEIFHRPYSVGGGDDTGIGLAIVRRMVERLGGRVWVESQAGTGSTFSFALPLSVPDGLDNHTDQEVQAA